MFRNVVDHNAIMSCNSIRQFDSLFTIKYVFEFKLKRSNLNLLFTKFWYIYVALFNQV